MNKKEEKVRKQLYEALLDLLEDTPLDKVKVHTLCKKAKVARSSFYMHYKHIEDILRYEYQNAHQQAFGNKEWTYEYLDGEEFIKDMVSFFDQNTKLLQVISKWHILDYVTRIPTKSSFSKAERMEHKELKEVPVYATIYLWGRYFDVCLAWVTYGKKESPKKMINVLKTLSKIK